MNKTLSKETPAVSMNVDGHKIGDCYTDHEKHLSIDAGLQFLLVMFLLCITCGGVQLVDELSKENAEQRERYTGCYSCDATSSEQQGVQLGWTGPEQKVKISRTLPKGHCPSNIR